MIRFALKGLLARKLRTALTAIGVVLGVSLISGTYVLTDSISSAFDSIFAENYRNTDVTITGKTAFVPSDDGTVVAPPFQAGLLPQVRELPEVGAASGSVVGSAQMIGRDGKAITTMGPPTLGFSVDAAQPQFNSLTLVSGVWPVANEVVIDTTTAQKQGFGVGDTIGIQARGAARQMRITGLVRFGEVASIGGATLAGFELGTAQLLFEKAGQLDQILIAAKQGVDSQQLVAAVERILPSATQVRTAEEQATQDSAGTTSFIGFLQTFLLVFGGIALFVGSFVIANSLSITIAQRTREFATLRTLGASRRQVLGSVVLEAFVTGLVSSVAGLFFGLAIATGLFKLFDSVGLSMPNNGLVFQTRTIVVAILVGVVVTVLASLRPAWRATRVPPIAAVREGATLAPGRLHRYRPVGAAVLAVAGVACVLAGLFVDGLATRTLLSLLGAGVLLLFIGTALFSSRLVRPLAAVADPVARWAVVVLTVIAWPFFLLPLWLIRRLFRRPAAFPGVLPDRPAVAIGGQNSRRDPARTASTAAALMIGLALVTLVATLGAGIIKPFEEAVDGIFSADYAITAQNNFSPLPPTVAAAVSKVPSIAELTSVRGGQARAFDKTISITAVDKTAPELLRFDWRSGSQESLGQLEPDGAIINAEYADEHSLSLDSPLELELVTGEVVRLRVRGIFRPPAGGSPFGSATMATTTFDGVSPQPQNIYTFVNMRGGVTPENTAALGAALTTFPNAKALTRDQFKKAQTDSVKGILNVLYVLLALSVLVSLFGIVNTLVLTVFERTRELGMLRAIGLTRGQVKRMIRQESVMTALIGAAIGIVLGLGLAALLAARLDEITFTVPTGQLVIFAVVSVVVGIFAAIWPARRAARLNPLEALQYE
ncbi:ABC transporter permease [Kribbella sp. NBC_01245]|uniref:ABC transporter permease n=1 Tax=Kribbella sp. NBC_01245 TaxID=2903578 RepID=UPI002E2DD421|nr:FtsX-like permease family protein [Kribbella sp. NBC_01245]